MSDKTRKRIWLMPVAAAIGVVAVLAVLAATVWMPSTAQAQAPFVPPNNLVATEISATQINLSWNAGLGQASLRCAADDRQRRLCDRFHGH